MSKAMDTDSADLHLADIMPRATIFRSWEKVRYKRIHWLIECIGEAGGAFTYCWFGMGANMAYVVPNILGLENVGSILTIGFGYGMGIVLALCIFAATSGGHFNPCVTISFCVYRGFPWRKAPQYILSQIFGAFIAGLLVYAQWRDLILEAEALLASKSLLEATLFTSQGPAGVLALYAPPGSNLGYVWLNEFVTDTMIGLAIWACLDPTNAFVPPAAAPWAIAFTYSAAIWAFATPALAANTARDLGGRLAAMTIYGTKANGGTYAAIASLTSIPAMLFAATIYEFILADSSRVVPPAQRNFVRGHMLHHKHREQVHGFEGRYAHATGVETGSSNSSTNNRDKGRSEMIEHA